MSLLRLLLCAGAADAMHYSRYRLTFTRVRDLLTQKDSHRGVAIGELALFVSRADKDRITVASATNPGGSNPRGQEPYFAVDANVTTKWFDYLPEASERTDAGNIESVLELTLASREEVHSYRLWTAVDAPKRDPTRWKLEASNPGDAGWTLLHDATVDAPPEARRAPYELIWLDGFAPPPPPPFAEYRLVMTQARARPPHAPPPTRRFLAAVRRRCLAAPR